MAPGLATLLADPARVAEVPATELPALLAAVSTEAARLDTLRAVLAARLAAPAVPNGHHLRDIVTDVGEVARIVRHSPSWVRKNGHTLPGFRQPGGKGTRVGWDRAALVAWATSGA